MVVGSGGVGGEGGGVVWPSRSLMPGALDTFLPFLKQIFYLNGEMSVTTLNSITQRG